MTICKRCQKPWQKRGNALLSSAHRCVQCDARPKQSLSHMVLGSNRCTGVNNYSSERIPQIAVDSHTAQPRARYVIVHGAAIPVYNVIESSSRSTTPKSCSVAVLRFELASSADTAVHPCTLECKCQECDSACGRRRCGDGLANR